MVPGGSNELFALLNDGNVITIGETNVTTYPTVSNVVDIAAYLNKRFVAFASGSTKTWGGNATNQSTLTNVLYVAQGSVSNVCLRSDSKVQLLNPTNTSPGLLKVGTHTKIAAYGTNIFALKVATPQLTKYSGSLACPTTLPPLSDIAIQQDYGIGLLSP